VRSPNGMFYEVHGAGHPVVLLHGGLGGTISWTQQVPALVQWYQVFVPEQRGRGRTPDVPEPITYQSLTDDVVSFLTDVVSTPTHLVGASDGGIVGLIVAMQRPELLRRLVCLGANFHRDGFVAGSGWKELSADHPSWALPRERYEAISPDGAEHWPVIFGKLQRMWNEEPTFRPGDLNTISMPVLVMAGDDDAVSLTHTVELYEALPQGQLAIVPGTSHAAFLEKPDLVNELIVRFLQEEGSPETMLPIRRRTQLA
jgi:pimeloyl-ACP methyl ester carboxylesterase